VVTNPPTPPFTKEGKFLFHFALGERWPHRSSKKSFYGSRVADTDTVTLFLRGPGIRDGSFVAFLEGTDIEMESGEILQWEVQFSRRPQVNCLDILVTLITEVDPIGLLSLGIEIVKRSQLLIIAEGADHPIDSPLISTIGTEEKSFSNLFFQ